MRTAASAASSAPLDAAGVVGGVVEGRADVAGRLVAFDGVAFALAEGIIRVTVAPSWRANA